MRTKHYTTIRTYRSAANVECRTPNEPPSRVGNRNFIVLPPTQLKETEGYTSMRLSLEADVIVHDSIDQPGYPDLRFRFEGDQLIEEYDKLSKFLTGDAAGCTGTFHITLAKEFPLSATNTNNIIVELVTPFFDESYRPGSQITLSNIVFTFDYAQ